MMGKSPMMKKLVGKQNNLPEELKAKIEASPAKKYKSAPMKNYKKGYYGADSPMREDVKKAQDLGSIVTGGGTTNKPKKKKTLREWFKSTKLSKDLKVAGGRIKKDVSKIKKGFESPNLNPHTGEKESRLSRSVGNKKRDFNRIKRKISNL